MITPVFNPQDAIKIGDTDPTVPVDIVVCFFGSCSFDTSTCNSYCNDNNPLSGELNDWYGWAHGSQCGDNLANTFYGVAIGILIGFL